MIESILETRFLQPDNWRWGEMVNRDDHPLRYGTAPLENPAAHVVYVQGRGESAEMTFELARDFNRLGLSYSVFDRRGQGLSGRFLSDTFKQHSQGFDPDVRDLIQFVRDVVAPSDDAPIIVLGHSTGATISLLAAHDAPEYFKGLVLAAPLLGISEGAARDKESIWAKLPLPQFLREHYIPHGNAAWDRSDPSHRLNPGDYSSHPVRSRLHDHWMQANEGLRVASPTMGWFQDICRALVKFRSPGYMRDIRIPVRIFTAGQDVKVNNHYALDAASQLPDAVLTHFGKAKHDMLQEIDAFRTPVIRAVVNLATHGNRPRGIVLPR